MVEGFRQFVAQSGIHDFKILNSEVDVFGVTAVATLLFRIKHEQNGQILDENGSDILVFAREHKRWQVVWRTQFPSAREGA